MKFQFNLVENPCCRLLLDCPLRHIHHICRRQGSVKLPCPKILLVELVQMLTDRLHLLVFHDFVRLNLRIETAKRHNTLLPVMIDICRITSLL